MISNRVGSMSQKAHRACLHSITITLLYLLTLNHDSNPVFLTPATTLLVIHFNPLAFSFNPVVPISTQLLLTSTLTLTLTLLVLTLTLSSRLLKSCILLNTGSVESSCTLWVTIGGRWGRYKAGQAIIHNYCVILSLWSPPVHCGQAIIVNT